MSHLLVVGNLVRLHGCETVALPGSDGRWIRSIPERVAYVISRYRLVAVARGSMPIEWLPPPGGLLIPSARSIDDHLDAIRYS